MDTIRGRPIPIGNPTVTLCRPVRGTVALTQADVVSIHARAYQRGQVEPFWEADFDTDDLLAATATVDADWTADDIGYTFEHELAYGTGADPYYPPLGLVTIEYVLKLSSDRGWLTIAREVEYVPGLAVHRGHVS